MALFDFFTKSITIGGILILSMFFGVIYFFWKYDNGSSIKMEISQIKQAKSATHEDIQSLEMKILKIQNINKVIGSLGNEVQTFFQYIPSTMTSAKILRYLNEQAKNSGVHIEDITNYKNIEKKEFYEKLRVNLTIVGSFGELLLFITKLTDLKEIIIVEKFMIEGKKYGIHGNRNVLKKLKMKMDIYTYRYKPIKKDSTAKKAS